MTQQSVAADVGSRTAADSADPPARPRIALVGVHGFGERHLANLARLEEAGALELVAVADPAPPSPGGSRTPWPSSGTWNNCSAPVRPRT